MVYDYTRFNTLSNANGTSIEDVAQSSFNEYWTHAPNKKTGTIDGVAKDFIIQNKTYIDKSQNHDYIIAETDSGMTYGSLIVWSTYTWLIINMEVRAIETHLAGRAHLCNRTFKIETSSVDVVTDYDSLGRPIISSTPSYLETPCVYRDSSSVGSDSDLGNAINIPHGHILIFYKNDASHTVEKGMTFLLDGLKYIIVGIDKSRMFDNVGCVNVLAKEVTLDENA